MISIYSISALILAYLFGSIPTAVWIGQAFYGIDVREYGSGNAGATNTFRVLGKKAGIAVMVLDIFKGYTATNLAYLIGQIMGFLRILIILQKKYGLVINKNGKHFQKL